MPQALTIDATQSSGTTKRQRSADSRETHSSSSRPISKHLAPQQLKATVRVPAYLDKTKSEISSTFQDLEWKQRFRIFHALENPQTSPFRVDRSNVVINRNRYGNVQPWDQSRVKLQVPIDGSDYINASPIVLKRATTMMTTTTMTSSGAQRESGDATSFDEAKYIASQGPKSDQSSHFWAMVHQETTGTEGVIVMLTQCYEANKEKCAVYFPTSLENPVMTLYQDEQLPASETASPPSEEDNEIPAAVQAILGTVTLISASHDSSIGCDVRVLDVDIANSKKRINHYLFNGWPDFGRPEADDRVALLNLIRKSFTAAKGSPRIVHCSAGVGRTGAFIALDFLIREIEEGRFLDHRLYPYLQSPTYLAHPDHATQQDAPTETWGKSGPPKVQTPTTDVAFFEDSEQPSFRDDLIYSTVNTLREQRMMMVMNELQYALLYEIVREVFWAKYSSPAEGVTVKAAETSALHNEVPPAKAARVEEDGSVSDAETEIIDPKEPESDEVSEPDPYLVVAPENVREGLSKHK